MALGDVVQISPNATAIELLASAATANGAPSGAAGLDMNSVRTLLGDIPENGIRIAIISTAGSGTMTAQMRLWAELGSLGWVVVQALNHAADPFTAVAIGETSSDKINYSEEVHAIAGADRLYLEIIALGGTSTAVKGELVIARQ
ncbi:MAG TPA: hypothetical protein VGG74_11775 [Kofleriaceae bacterium]|jgi:hypothetical protein